MARGDFDEDEFEDDFDDPDDDDEWGADLENDEEDEDADFQGLQALTVDDTVRRLRDARQHADPRWLRADGRIALPSHMKCRVCGCTEDLACSGGCLWAAPNLCSRCVS